MQEARGTILHLISGSDSITIDLVFSGMTWLDTTDHCTFELPITNDPRFPKIFVLMTIGGPSHSLKFSLRCSYLKIFSRKCCFVTK